MKIGIDARMYSSEFTGIGRYVYELIENLQLVDHKNEYVIFLNPEEYAKFEPKNKRIRKVMVKAQHYSFAEQVSFLRILKKAKLDLMHFTHFNVPILYRRPSIVTIHDLTLSFYPGKKMNSWIHRLAYNVVLKNAVRHAKKIIAVSENTKVDLIELLHVSPNKIDVVYEGVSEKFTPKIDKEKNDDVLKKYGIGKEFLLYTGVWRGHKNLVNLIKSFAILTGGDSAVDAQLVITGNEDPYYPEVKRTVKELNVEHAVIFPGMVSEDELISLYQSAKLYVFPSLYEGFGLPPLEAMRCGTPVVASKTACIPEVCGEDNALYFDPYDPTEMADMIQRVWVDETLQKQLHDHGLKHSLKFSWEKMAESILKIYESCI